MSISLIRQKVREGKAISVLFFLRHLAQSPELSRTTVKTGSLNERRRNEWGLPLLCFLRWPRLHHGICTCYLSRPRDPRGPSTSSYSVMANRFQHNTCPHPLGSSDTGSWPPLLCSLWLQLTRSFHVVLVEPPRGAGYVEKQPEDLSCQHILCESAMEPRGKPVLADTFPPRLS